MINALDTFFVNLFGTSSITLYCGTDVLLNFSVSYWLLFLIIFFCCLIISFIFIWFFHIIFEKVCKHDC